MIKVKHKDIAEHFNMTTDSVAYFVKKRGGLKTFADLVDFILFLKIQKLK